MKKGRRFNSKKQLLGGKLEDSDSRGQATRRFTDGMESRKTATFPSGRITIIKSNIGWINYVKLYKL